jgi:HEPN domain-containing protein
MDNELINEWLRLADNDLDVAHILNGHHPRHLEVICYHCQQSAEKYFKAFLIANDIEAPKIHDLRSLCTTCEEIISDFENIKAQCRYLTQFGSQPRYPFEIEIDDTMTDLAIDYAETIKNFSEIQKLRNETP